jgi:hypothetical protein
MFDRHDIDKGKNVVDQYNEAFKFNIGSQNNPRMVKISKGTTLTERESVISLIHYLLRTIILSQTWNIYYKGLLAKNDVNVR